MPKPKTKLPSYSRQEFKALLKKHQAHFNDAWIQAYQSIIERRGRKQLPPLKPGFVENAMIENHYLRLGYHDCTSETELVSQYAVNLAVIAAALSHN